MAEEMGIYRGEVVALMGAVADVILNTDRILELLEGDGEEDEEENA
jgi:hypothetical protein